MNRSKRRNLTPPPTLRDKKVELVEMKRTKDLMVWVVTLCINGWPHDIKMWGRDELDIFKQVKELQRGVPNNVS